MYVMPASYRKKFRAFNNTKTKFFRKKCLPKFKQLVLRLTLSLFLTSSIRKEGKKGIKPKLGYDVYPKFLG